MLIIELCLCVYVHVCMCTCRHTRIYLFLYMYVCKLIYKHASMNTEAHHHLMKNVIIDDDEYQTTCIQSKITRNINRYLLFVRSINGFYK